MNLVDYLELVGRASGSELLKVFGERLDREQLYTLVADKDVSVHTTGFGEKYYRYPYLGSKAERMAEAREELAKKKAEKVEAKYQAMIEYVQKHPGCSGPSLKGVLELSHAAFKQREEYLVGAGTLIREKVGVTWHYTAKESKKR